MPASAFVDQSSSLLKAIGFAGPPHAESNDTFHWPAIFTTSFGNKRDCIGTTLGCTYLFRNTTK